eukprot:GFUD01017727.1.p1 GENE.GFUD01017727.1~~GFUD01017727.1.p1  ORF type:complete len:362 (+),score=72.82 GFUD01017727.1:183-1268(+)
MSANSALSMPAELNNNLLNTLYEFQPLSKLKTFLIHKTGVEYPCYSLAEILTILKDVIRGEGLFDEANPSVILCSEELEEALNMKALHVTEIRDLVLSQVTKVPDQTREKFTQSINNCKSNNIQVSTESDNQVWVGTKQTTSVLVLQNPVHPKMKNCQQRNANISTVVVTDQLAKFSLKPKFLKVVQTVPGIDPKQTSFSYEEITSLLSKYILSRKDQIFDKRNLKLALVGKDPLGEAFGVKAFHRCQVNILIRTQLITDVEEGYDNDTDDDADTTKDEDVVTNTTSPGINVLIPREPFKMFSKKGTHEVHSLKTDSRSGQNERLMKSTRSVKVLSKLCQNCAKVGKSMLKVWKSCAKGAP